MKNKLACLLILCIGCSLAQAGEENPKDPLEGFNRTMFAINEGLDEAVAKPIAKAYDYVTPLPIRVATSNFFGNVADVMTGANNLLQGKPSDAFTDWGRFLLNATFGIGGLFDLASEFGMDKHNEDFGQTLAVWGVPSGAYLFWPVLGPRNIRDTAAWFVDTSVDPIWYIQDIPVRNTLAGIRYIDQRASLLPTDRIIEEGALDKYAYIRDAYLQHRQNAIHDGNPPRNPQNKP